MKTYQHLFFDLDHTLWDYDRNVTESLSELYQIYSLQDLGIPTFEKFFESFHAVNFQLWDWYNVGKIDKHNLRKERFPRIFAHAGGNFEEIPAAFEEDFMHRTSSKPHVFPYSKEILTYLKTKYRIHVITNGFNESQAQTAQADTVIVAERYFDSKSGKMIANPIGQIWSGSMMLDHLGYPEAGKAIFNAIERVLAADNSPLTPDLGGKARTDL